MDWNQRSWGLAPCGRAGVPAEVMEPLGNWSLGCTEGQHLDTWPQRWMQNTSRCGVQLNWVYKCVYSGTTDEELPKPFRSWVNSRYQTFGALQLNIEQFNMTWSFNSTFCLWLIQAKSPGNKDCCVWMQGGTSSTNQGVDKAAKQSHSAPVLSQAVCMQWSSTWQGNKD